MYFLDMCQDIGPLIKLIKNGLIPLLQLGIPIVLVVLGMIDLGKAVIASKEDEIKKAQGMLIKRVIYAVAVFFVVTIVMLIFNMVVSSGAQGNEVNSWYSCWKQF